MDLSNLHTLKSYRLRRLSSYNRSGRNEDNVLIPAGKSFGLEEAKGPGVIRHIWMAFSPWTSATLDGLVLRIYWDGSPTPAVETPIGHFFGMGFGKKAPLSSLPIVVSPSGASNAYFPMPFRSSARIEFENQGPQDCHICYHIDYETAAALPAEFGYFHTAWRAEACRAARGPDPVPANYDANDNYHDILANCTGADNYRVLEAAGRGHYCGCFLHVFSLLPSRDNWRCWWGEGDDMIFVDGESWPPAIHGTGAEDYFNGAWGFPERFCAPLFGWHYIDALSDTAGRYSAYRFHIPDAVPFRREIQATIEHGHGNERGDLYQSLAFFYLESPERATAALPDFEARAQCNDYQIVPRRIKVPDRKGPYDRDYLR